MTADREQRIFIPSPQAAGTSRFYSEEANDGKVFTLAASASGWALVTRLPPGLWSVRNVSGYQVGCQLAIAERSQPLEVDPTGAIVTSPRSFLADPYLSAVAEAAGRATAIEIDVDGRGCDLWGVTSGNGNALVRVSMLAPRAQRWGGSDRD